jgi:hypothetical protein
VELQATALNIRVGEVVTLTAKPISIGLPYYYLVVRDDGVQEAPPLARATYENVITALERSSAVLEFVSAQASGEAAIFIVRAIAPGLTTVGVTATGEVRTSAGDTWSGAGSGELVITVNP